MTGSSSRQRVIGQAKEHNVFSSACLSVPDLVSIPASSAGTPCAKLCNGLSEFSGCSTAGVDSKVTNWLDRVLRPELCGGTGGDNVCSADNCPWERDGDGVDLSTSLRT